MTKANRKVRNIKKRQDGSKKPLAATFQRALAYHEQGDIDKAEKIYTELLNEAKYVLTNLGMINRQKGRLEKAIQLHRLALSLSPTNEIIHRNLLNALLDARQFDQAEDIARSALKHVPNDKWFMEKLAGACLQQAPQLGACKIEEAINAYRCILDQEPEDSGIASRLAECFIRVNRIKEAADTLEPYKNNPRISYRLQVLRGDKVNRAPDGYVQIHFDDFASSFETKLVDALQYKTPQLLLEILNKNNGYQSRFKNVLDLGCGTGLAGVELVDRSEVMTGIDLSPKMLDLAREKEIYDNLEVAEIEAFLSETSCTYDLIIAADVFVYIGNLRPIMALVSEKLSLGGIFLFSTEHAEDGEFRVQSNGRYLHSESYIRETANSSGLKVEFAQHTPIRKEYGNDVMGGLYLLVASKPER